MEQSHKMWVGVVSDLQLSLSRVYFDSYIRKLKATFSIESGRPRLKLGCSSIYIMGEVKRRCGEQIQESVDRVVGESVLIDYVVDTRSEVLPGTDNTPLFTAKEDLNRDLESTVVNIGFRKELSLESFAVSSSNEMAYAAAKAVSQNPGKAYNPLFLYGGVGVGKTHLMQGVGRKILESNLEIKTIYCSGEEFTNEIIDAIRRKSTSNFKRKYRSVGLLLIDDIQFIAGKATVQEEFFHTFNAILKEGGQVIMTSDKPPKEIDALEERLRSRFEGGLTIDIGEPNFELRTAILMIKSRQMKIKLSPEVAQKIAQKIEDTRELIGALAKLSALAQISNGEITLEKATQILKLNDLNSGVNRVTNPDVVVGEVADYYGVDKVDVLGSRRLKTIVLPRHVAMYLLVSVYKKSLVEVGGFFGGRDHTTVMHAIDKVSGLLKTNTQISNDLNTITSKLGA